MEYCKSDLVASKGVLFVKYRSASSALRALEDMASRHYNVCCGSYGRAGSVLRPTRAPTQPATPQVAGYRVRARLADPKQLVRQPSRGGGVGKSSAGLNDFRRWHSGKVLPPPRPSSTGAHLLPAMHACARAHGLSACVRRRSVRTCSGLCAHA